MHPARRLSVFLCLLVVAVGNASAHGPRGRVGISVGTTWGPWMFPPPWYYQPTIVVPPAEPKVYIEQNPVSDAAFWHYCRSQGGYYPYVQECPEGWIQVLPEGGKEQ